MISGEVLKYLKGFFVVIAENYRGSLETTSSPDSTVNKVMEHSGSANEDEIIRATARLFGFQRVGPSLKIVIERVVNELPYK